MARVEGVDRKHVPFGIGKEAHQFASRDGVSGWEIAIR